MKTVLTSLCLEFCLELLSSYFWFSSKFYLEIHRRVLGAVAALTWCAKVLK